jgi:hypothetical protein
MLAASFFIKAEDEGGNPMRKAADAVLHALLSSVAPLAHQTPEALLAQLRQAGFKVDSAEQTLISVTGPERDAQFKALGLIFH